MSIVLQWRREARNLQWNHIQMKLESYRICRSESYVWKKYTYMASFHLDYLHYERWRRSMITRECFHSPMRPNEFLSAHQHVMKTSHNLAFLLQFLENHFFFFHPNNFISLENEVRTMWMSMVVVPCNQALLQYCYDQIQQWRQVMCPLFHGNHEETMPTLQNVKLILSHCLTQTHCHDLWYSMYTASNECECDITCLVDKLEWERQLCQCLGLKIAFFDIRARTLVDMWWGSTCSIDDVISCPLIREHISPETFLSTWIQELNPLWKRHQYREAISKTRLFVRQYESSDIPSMIETRVSVLRHFREHICHYLEKFIVMCLENHDKKHQDHVHFVAQFGNCLPSIVHVMAQHASRIIIIHHDTKHRTDIYRRYLNYVEMMEMLSRSEGQRLRFHIEQLVEGISFSTPLIDLRMISSPSWLPIHNVPSTEIQDDEFAILKKEIEASYYHTYPSRKLRWCDWHSSVILQEGITVHITQYVVLRLFRGSVTSMTLAEIRQSLLPMDKHTLYGILHSLLSHPVQPLLSKKGSMKVSEWKSTDLMRVMDRSFTSMQYTIPLNVCSPRQKDHSCESFSSFDGWEAIRCEAWIVQRVKKEGPLSIDRLQRSQDYGFTDQLFHQCLQQLVQKEYIRVDTKTQRCIYIP